MSEGILLLQVLVFPGILFLLALAMALEWVDRKAVARLQARVGPPVLQPLADLVKLLGKEVVTPEGADRRVLDLGPAVALAAVVTAFLLVPVSGASPLAFPGDIVVALYLMTLPTIVLFLLGWTSRNVYSAIGSVRAVTQLFVYEVPFYLALVGPAIAAGTWSISGITAWQGAHGPGWILQPVGLVVALVGLQAKCERTPFDIPDAETEVLAGPLTELTGRRLGVFLLSRSALLVAGCALLAALYLGGPLRPFGDGAWPGPVEGFAWFLGRTLLLLLLLSALRAGTARIRIDQLNDWGWRVLTPASILQILLVVLQG